MVDIPGDSSTTSTITIGGTVDGTLETAGDHDWYAITLSAGQQVEILLSGMGFAAIDDPYLRVRDSSGTIIAFNDDGGTGLNSRLAFEAAYSGTYYIDVASWAPDNDPTYSDTGTYQLEVKTYVPPVEWTNDQIANQLTTGYWEGSTHHFNVTQGGTITVNLSGLTPDAIDLARQALAMWTDVIGVTFQEVSGAAQISFDDAEAGAHASASWTGVYTDHADVNVAADWASSWGSGLDTYRFQTFIHEIGHALGLGHAGNYNDEASYPFDASYSNDGWPITVMSYFAQDESTYWSSRNFSFAFVNTPMVADIIAMGNLYGLSTTTRTGNTVYGIANATYGTMANRDVFNAALYPEAVVTIFDSAGTDTINYATFNVAQRIDLNPETFSNVAGLIGNLSIARGVPVENAIGGGGADSLIGNSLANLLVGNGGGDTILGNDGDDALTGGSGADVLTGGSGADIFSDTRANMGSDTITDFTSDDSLLFTDAVLGSFTFSLSGSILTYTGGSLTISGGVAGNLTATAAAGGGVQLRIGTAPVVAEAVHHDFNGDGRSDILWRQDGGSVIQWLGQADGSFVFNPAINYALPVEWSFASAGDYNGDGRSDILWRTGESVIQWLGQADGSFAFNAAANNSRPTDWHVVGTGDFNGDNRDDVMWRNDNGTFTHWLGSADGSFTASWASYAMPTDWQVMGTGDFNGDGRADILWRQDGGSVIQWLGQSDGSFAFNPAISYALPTDWHFAGAGDFNGDSRVDIVWRMGDSMIEWLGQADGSFAFNAAANNSRTADWHVVGTGDFNGDSFDDIMWRNDSGTFTHWLGSANGSFTDSWASYAMPTDWNVQPSDVWA